jgi:hypothetical protein
LLAAPIALFALRAQLAGFGRDAVLQSLAERPLTKPISELLTGLGSFVGLAAGPLLGRDAASLEGMGHLIVGAAFPLLFMVGWYRFCVLPMWESWDTQCFQWLCRPSRIPPHPTDRLLRPFLLVVFAIVPLALSVRALFQPDVGRLLGEGVNTLITAPVVLMSLLFVAGAVLLIVQGPLLVFRWIRGRALSKDAHRDS